MKRERERERERETERQRDIEESLLKEENVYQIYAENTFSENLIARYKFFHENEYFPKVLCASKSSP